MTSRRRSSGVKIMYGARSTRTLEPREPAPLSHLSSMPTRRASAYGTGERLNRGKAVDDDRIVRGDIRVTAGFMGKARGVIEHADQFTSAERRNFKDDGILKMVGRSDEALRGGASSKGPRAVRSSATYVDDPKWISSSSRNGNYESFNYDGVPSLRGSADYAKASSSGGAVLPGFILESHRRTILDFEQKGSFFLPLDDRRLAEQIGPGTKIFMLDSSARELHGVFQAESFATIDVDATSRRVPDGTSLRVRVRIAKECIPLTERQFKDILEDNYYNHSKLSAALTKEQVTRLLHSYRPADTGRNLPVPIPSSRRTLDPSLPQSSQDFHNIPDDVSYRKDWRRGPIDTRSFSSHSYQSQDAPRFSSKLPVQTLPSKEVYEYEDYDVDEVVDNMPLGSSRLVAAPNLYPSRGKQNTFRSLPGSRAGVNQVVGNANHSELKLTEADWREEIDPRDIVYRKNRPLSPSSLEDIRRRDRSFSPPWKDVGEIYERPGKARVKEESSFLPSRRRRQNDIDLNIPVDMGHGEPAHLHDLDSKAVRRVWEDEKEYSLSPSKGRSLLPPTSFRLPDHLVDDDNLDNSRMDSRHMINLSRKEIALLRRQERGRPVTGTFSNVKHGKLHPRIVTSENFTREKSVAAPLLRKKPIAGRDIYNKESDMRSSRAPVFKIKANFQTPGRGRPERVVTFLNSAHPRPRLDGIVDKDGFRPWKASTDGFNNGSVVGHGRKRKSSVWSRIVLPEKGSGQGVGRGRVFTRLGPSVNASFNKFRDDAYNPHKRQKGRAQQVENDPTSERPDAQVEDSPDALEGEDYLNDDQDGPLEESDKETEKAVDDLQGWTRKKAALVGVNSGDEYSNPDQGDYANAKGGRRKLVRPSIVAKGEAVEGGWKQTESSPAAGEDHEKPSGKPRGYSDSMDIELANAEIQAAEGDSPLCSPLNRNSPADDNLDFEEDNMMP